MKMLVRCSLLLGLCSMLGLHLAAAPLGTAFSYQGKLAVSGTPANGNYDLKFILYDDPSGGNAVGGPITNSPVGVTNGLFSTTLDFGAGVFTGDARWLGLAVRTNGAATDFTLLTPRQVLGPAPYALYAPSAGAAATATTAASANAVAAVNITGTLALAQLPAAVVTNNETGVTLTGTFSGNGAGLTSIPFSALPAVPLTNHQGGVTFNGMTTVSNLSVTATNFANYLVVTNPPALNGSAITSLNASQLASGTVPLAQLPGVVLTNGETGTVTFNGDLVLPATGVIYAGVNTLMHVDGSQDFFAGPGAGNLTLYGIQNTGVGYQALANDTSGSYNTAHGAWALVFNSSGSNNTANGYQALYSNTHGSYNTANGYQALRSNTEGTGNTANGVAALLFNTDGSYNTADGENTLWNNTSGSWNTADGFFALYYNTNGWCNTASGGSALFGNKCGWYNTADGYVALAYNTTGSNNTAIGRGALYLNTNGCRNIALGALAGEYLTTGNDNVDIGNYGVDGDSATIRIGMQGTQTRAFVAGIYGTTVSSGTPVYADSSGQLGTGAGSPVALLNSDETFTGQVTFNNPGDSFAGNGSGLSSLNASQLASGTVPLAQLPGVVLTNGESATVTFNGDLVLPAAGVIYSGSSTLVHTYGYDNFFAGPKAGNLTLTGDGNTGIGYQALFANTSGRFNTANGFEALYSNTEGILNTANGFEALHANTSGAGNTANGVNALFANTTGSDNTANGVDALFANTSGYDNTANGYKALYANTNGIYNTANGALALFANTSGFENTANGYQALYSNTNGSDNTANGALALYANTSGSDNTANGVQALYANTSGSNNTANGAGALYANTIGFWNTANGKDALFSNTVGMDNTANGALALFANTVGYANTANGFQALYANTSGYGNTASGVQALSSNTNGIYNTANGYAALYSNTSGNENTANGAGALHANTTGAYNTADGSGSLYNSTSGSYNIALGYHAGLNLTTGNNNIDIGNQGVAGESVTIRIGTPGTHANVFIAGIYNSTVSGVAVQVDASGHLGMASSSRKFKQDIQSMAGRSEELFALRPVSFKYKPEIEPQGLPQFGLIAEEVDQVDPNLVIHDQEHGIYTVRYEAVNAMLLNEFLKEHRKVKAQDAKIQALEQSVAELTSLVNALVEKSKGGGQ